MPAAKHLDPLIGIDVHIVQPPGPVPPVPVPHPFVGMVFDPIDYAPYVGATVMIAGLPRAQAGTAGIALCRHVPAGGVFVNPPANEAEVFMGSSTVAADGDAQSYLGLPALTCQDIGLAPIARPGKPASIHSLVLPTTIVIAIPAPVLVGGAPTVSLTALGCRAAMAALAAGFQKLKKLRGKKGKRRPKRTRQNGACGRHGEPIDVTTGANVDDFIDVEAEGDGALCWRRFYSSADARADGPLGYGFRHGYQHALRINPRRIVYTDPARVELELPPLEQDGDEAIAEGYVLRRRDRTHYALRRRDTSMELVVDRRDDVGDIALLGQLRRGAVTLDFEHDAGGRLIAIVERGIARVTLAYDAADRIIEVRRAGAGGPARVIASYAYDAAGCLARFTDAAGHEATYRYDDERRMTRKTDRRGYSFHYEYDAIGRCVRSYGDDGLYDVRVAYQLERGQATVTYPDGGAWVHHIDEDDGTIRKIVDPYGGVFRRLVDEEGKVVAEIDAGGATTALLYDAAGGHYARRDPRGWILPPLEDDPDPPDPLAHDAPDVPRAWLWGRLAEALSPAPLGAGYLDAPLPPEIAAEVAEIDAAHRGALPPPREERDALGRLIARADAAGRRQTWEHDPNGNITAYHDRDGAIHRRYIGSWNQVIAVADPLGGVTRFERSATEQLTRVIDAGGSESAYDYDQKDRLVRVVRHGVVREEYRYDRADRLIAKLDGQGRPLLDLTIGPNGLCSRRRLASGEVHLFEHDERGRFTRASTAQHEIALRVDAAGRRELDTRDGLGVSHWYGDDGRLRSTALLKRFRIEVRHGSGAMTVTDPTGHAHRFRRGLGGQLLRELSNGTSEIATYDDLGRCTGKVTWAREGAGLRRWSAAYRYSDEGELRMVFDRWRGATWYEYDAAHRLVGERGPMGEARRFAYDPAGNLVEIPGVGPLAYAEGNRLLGSRAETFEHDARNHLSVRRSRAGGERRYHYNSLDLLVRVDDGGEPWTAEYDGLSRRIRKGRGSRQTSFYWDGDRMAAEIDPDGRVRVYLYPDPDAFVPFMFVDYPSLDADPHDGKRYFLFTNAIGVPLHVEDAYGEVVWWATRVDPYGAVEVHPSSRIELNLRAPGHYFDPETGLHCNRFRSYSPELGRYLQSDPAGESGGINLYAYPANPLLHVDLFGLHAKQPPRSHKPGITAAGPNCENPVAALESGAYGDLTKRSVVGDGLHNDHIPSFAAAKESIEKLRGGKELSAVEAANLRNNLTAIAEPEAVHRGHSRTYGGRNTQQQIASDADDLRRATADDCAAIREGMIAAGHDPAAVDAALQQIKDRNDQIGLYDPNRANELLR